MNRRLERKLDALRDGALGDAERRALLARLERDPTARERIRQTEQLGRVVRDAWTDGPAAPTAEGIIAAIRPGLSRIDAEIEAARPRGLGRLLEPLRQAFQPQQLGLIGAAAALALALTWPGGSGPGVVVPTEPLVVAERAVIADEPAHSSAIYDLAQGENPLMVLESADGSTVIWMLEPEDHVSQRAPIGGVA